MRAVVTRVSEASVAINGEIKGRIGGGLLVLLGVGPNDSEKDAVYLADRITLCRMFSDENGKMNLNLAACGGEILVVSQFTLYADLRSRRPGFTTAAGPEIAKPLYEKFMAECRKSGFHVECGKFGADMQVSSVNDGPVTFLFESKN